ncbi:MAG: Uma2 family endonuclease [Okeania sp. SIO2H7]|nr:Uma2 family endonuclease [Okeania sp. SIO2H7]
MTQAIVKPELMTLDEFLEWYPDGKGRFELHNGEIVKMPATGTHEKVVSFLATKFGIQTENLKLPYYICRQSFLKPIDSDASAFIPDIAVIDDRLLENEPMWKGRSLITKGETIPLIVEVVSTNWQDDYEMKFKEYERLGITEYWIVDYLGLGGRRYLGNPKQPTIFVYQLVEGEYAINLFRGSDRIQSSIFPEFNLTAEQVFQVGQ